MSTSSVTQLVGEDALPLVSIIICSFNHAHYLAEAIDSALHQSHPLIEVVVVDDGSVDETPQVAASFPGVTYLHQQNFGLANARNRGLRACKGSFVVFLDADDRLLPGAIATSLAAAMRRSTCAFVAGGYRLIDGKGDELLTRPAGKIVASGYADLLRYNFIAMHGAVLYRRELLIVHGGFNERFSASEDYDVYLRLSRQHPFHVYDEVVAEYRQHGENMTRDVARMLIAAVAVLEAQHPYVFGHSLLQDALDEGLAYYRSTYGRAVLRRATKRLLRRSEWRIACSEAALVIKIAPRAFWSVIAVIVDRYCHRIGLNNVRSSPSTSGR